MKASFFSVSLALAALALAAVASDSVESTSAVAVSVGDGQTTLAEVTYCEPFQTSISYNGRLMIDMPYCYCETDYLSDEYVYGYVGNFRIESYTSASADKYYVQYGDQFCYYSGSSSKSDFVYHSSYFNDHIAHYGTFGPSYANHPCFCPTVAVECDNTSGSCFVAGEVCFSIVPLASRMHWWIILLITFGTVLVVSVIVTIAVINSRMRRSSSESDREPLIEQPTSASLHINLGAPQATPPNAPYATYSATTMPNASYGTYPTGYPPNNMSYGAYPVAYPTNAYSNAPYGVPAAPISGTAGAPPPAAAAAAPAAANSSAPNGDSQAAQ